uniref:Apple domain-containing protein n=1 Tax=Romanomermis culicivorax TaxID=13658 RepID=A0A915L8U6_ROMCU
MVEIFTGRRAIQHSIEDNCNFQGMDLENKYSAYNPLHCYDECYANTNCTHFTWIPKSMQGWPHCFLKKGTTLKDVEKTKDSNSKGNKCGVIASRLASMLRNLLLFLS